MHHRLIFPTLVLALVPVAAQAYIGPGMGLGAIAMLLGAVAAFAMVMVALVWFPLKRMLRRRRAAGAAAEE